MKVSRVVNIMRALSTTARTRQFGALVKEFERRFHSEWAHYGLARDLCHPFEPLPANIPVTVRALQDSDVPYLLSMNAPGISDRGPYVRMRRLNFLKRNIGQCYVAVTEEGTPCYMQWLIGARQNKEIQEYFDGIFPVLNPN